jgi:rare lipoprotein A
MVRLGAVGLGCLLLANCSASSKLASSVDPKYGVRASPRVIAPGQPVPKGGGVYRVGRPYTIAGRTYYPQENVRYRRDGIASWYGEDFHGRLTANGEIYDMGAISAAHPTLPIPSYVRVTNLANRRSLIVRVNDRGPYHGDREIDLSHRAAQLLGFHRHGLARVRVEYMGPAGLEGSYDRRLMATLRTGRPAPYPSAVRLAASGPAIAPHAAPLPPPRPFALGDDDVPTRQTARVSPRFAATDPPAARESLAKLRPTGVPSAMAASPHVAAPSPVSAYAPSRSMGLHAVTSGRGLY